MLSRPKSERCKRYLTSLKEGEKRAFVTDFTIHSIMVIMESFDKRRELKTFLLSLGAYEGLTIYNTSVQDEIKAVEISLEEGMSLDDAIQYSAALSLNVDTILSFDRHFDGLNIPRTEP